MYEHEGASGMQRKHQTTAIKGRASNKPDGREGLGLSTSVQKSKNSNIKAVTRDDKADLTTPPIINVIGGL